MRCKVCGTINVSANPACPAKIYEIPNVDIEDIDTIYVGRQGCACGCRGTYAHTSADVKRDAAKGHDSHNEPNDKLVLKRYARMKREAHRGVEVQDGYIFTIDMPNERVMRLYLNEDKYRHPDRNPIYKQETTARKALRWWKELSDKSKAEYIEKIIQDMDDRQLILMYENVPIKHKISDIINFYENLKLIY